MQPVINAFDLQRFALRAFTVLYQLRPDWGGSVVLSLGLDIHGAALSIGSNIAGAVSLAIDNDLARLREAGRTGAVDFVVNTLDEAIRAMKNEVRKRSPLSVALNANPNTAIEEIIARGLSPSLFSCFAEVGDPTSRNRAAQHFASMGATLLDLEAKEELDSEAGDLFLNAETVMAPLLAGELWSLSTYTFKAAAELRGFDSKARALLSSDDHLRRRWLESAPRILQSQRPPQRSLWLTQDEAEALHES